MQFQNFTPAVVITADQRRSRSSRDAVPAALGRLDAVPQSAVLLRFERTVGDEMQGVLSDGRHTVAALTLLVRLGGWRVGLGVGGVELPLPESTRAARGPAFIAARTAVGASRRSPVDVALRVSSGGSGRRTPTPVPGVGGTGAGSDVRAGATERRNLDGVVRHAELAESALWLLIGLLRRRSEDGWTVVEARDAGESGRAIARRLGISGSAVSQRLRRAGYDEGLRGARLCADLIDRCLRP